VRRIHDSKTLRKSEGGKKKNEEGQEGEKKNIIEKERLEEGGGSFSKGGQTSPSGTEVEFSLAPERMKKVGTKRT